MNDHLRENGAICKIAWLLFESGKVLKVAVFWG